MGLVSGDRVRRGAQVVRPSVQEAVAKQSERNGSSPLSILRSSGHVNVLSENMLSLQGAP